MGSGCSVPRVASVRLCSTCLRAVPPRVEEARVFICQLPAPTGYGLLPGALILGHLQPALCPAALASAFRESLQAERAASAGGESLAV